jgi:MFS family permease
MKKRQFILLFLGSILLWSGNGWLPLLPVYADQLGAQPREIGNYLSFAYIALTAGSFSGGWLSDRLQRRKLWLIIGGVLNIPVIWLMGQATNIWSLAAATAGCYFLAAMAATLVSILAGLFAEPGQRGRVFAVLTFTSPLMMLVSSAVMGPVVERWGFRAMFSGFAVYATLFILIACLVEDKRLEPAPAAQGAGAVKKPGLGKMYYLLILACTAGSIAYFASRLGISLAMNARSFTVTAISITGAVGGAVSLPFLPMIGWLSDRLGRKWLLNLCFLLGLAGLVILSAAVSQWQFCIVAALLALMLNGVTAVGSAQVTDSVPRGSLGKGMSLFNATTWIGGIIGMSLTGFALQGLGRVTTFFAVAFLPLVAILVLIPVWRMEVRKAAL